MLAIPIAGVVVLLLFNVIAHMVGLHQNGKGTISEPLKLEVLTADKQNQKQEPQRPKPKPIKPLMALKKPLIASQIESIDTPLTIEPLSELALDTILTSADISFSEPSAHYNVADNQQLLPLYREEPRYPKRALKRKVEGYVVLRFNINEQGKPTNIQVVEASPKRYFEREAKRALKEWKYQPEKLDGVIVAMSSQVVKLEFKLAK